MTARRKDNGDLEVVNFGGRTITYRAALLILVASATPVGSPLWSALGMSAQATPAQVALDHRVTAVEKKVDAVKEDVTEIKQQFTGFLVDFRKYRKELKQ